MMNALRPSTLALVGALTVACAPMQVSTDYDASVDFASLRSWAWVSGAPTEIADPRVDNSLLQERIRGAVEDALRQRGYEQHLVSAAVSEFDGDPAAAAGAYETAARLADCDRMPLLLAGEMWFAAGELDRSLESYRRASALEPHDLHALQGMIDVYTAQNDHWNVSEIYERAFSVAPDLRNEKKVMKAYKKSCKKANRTAQLA